jgi:hypothetical protein
MFFPDPKFSILDSDPHKRITVFLPQKIVSKLSEICSGIPDPGVKNAPDPGFGSATLHSLMSIPLLFLKRLGQKI